jgi:hypothetical protein
MFTYKDGLRFLAKDKIKDGYHSSNFKDKVGKNVKLSIRIKPKHNVLTGSAINFKPSLQRIQTVTLNGHPLISKIDYVVRDEDTIAFTFNITTRDIIIIEGLT